MNKYTVLHRKEGHQEVEADTWIIDSLGHLIFIADNQESEAYAPGEWGSVRKVEDKP